MPNLPAVSVCVCRADESACDCGKTERALRAWMHGKLTVPMTQEQRTWCLEEIDSVEGYSARDYLGVKDALLASGVIDAWLDYCRDKGLA